MVARQEYGAAAVGNSPQALPTSKSPNFPGHPIFTLPVEPPVVARQEYGVAAVVNSPHAFPTGKSVKFGL